MKISLNKNRARRAVSLVAFIVIMVILTVVGGLLVNYFISILRGLQPNINNQQGGTNDVTAVYLDVITNNTPGPQSDSQQPIQPAKAGFLFSYWVYSTNASQPCARPGLITQPASHTNTANLWTFRNDTNGLDIIGAADGMLYRTDGTNVWWLTITISASSNLMDWVALATNAGPIRADQICQYLDTNVYPVEFYRADY